VQSFSPQHRSDQLTRMRGETFDILVVGGGITGAGIARDAAMRGLRVALVEQSDFASGTSSKSSKLIHGGLRYLEQADFRLVFEGTAERARLMKQAPHVVRPLPFVYPVYKNSRRGPLVIQFGMWLYDLLALFRNFKMHRRLNVRGSAEVAPGLLTDGLRASMLYYDGLTDDARLTLENILAAHQHGAAIGNHLEMTGPLRNEAGRITGARIHDRLTGDEFELNSHVMIHAVGPWTNAVLGRHGAECADMIRPTRGVHLLVSQARLPCDHAIVMNSIQDGRVVFVIPWEGNVAIGTTDTDHTEGPDSVHATREDVDYLLETVNHFFPEAGLVDGDIRSTWAGLRPLVRDDGASAYDTSREHTILVHPEGRVTIAGGKLTTYRKMAEQCVLRALPLLPPDRSQGKKGSVTRTVPLPGAQDFDLTTEGDDAVEEMCTGALQASPSTSRRLLRTHGARWRLLQARVEAHPVLARVLDVMTGVTAAEIEHAVLEEMGMTLEDVMTRRTPLFHHGEDQGLPVVDSVASQMGELLDWSDEERTRNIHAYRQTVADARRWNDA